MIFQWSLITHEILYLDLDTLRQLSPKNVHIEHVQIIEGEAPELMVLLHWFAGEIESSLWPF